MSPRDLFRFSLGALTGHGLRSALSLLGVTIGVAAVVVLTALGEGARRYVVGQFTGLGTNLLIVLPGRVETTGIAAVGGTPNDLTLEDAQAVARSVRQARRVAPLSMGTASVAFGERRRQVALMGTTADYRQVRRVELAAGRFLPPGDPRRGAPVVVLGHKLRRELFAEEDAVGEIVRVGGWRMRVIGVLGRQGTKLGIDFDDTAIVPVATGMKMLDRRSLFRILVEVGSHTELPAAKESVRRLLTERHGEEDVTVLTQDAVISTFGAILSALTLAVAAIAAVSLTVAGIGIMNVMLVTVSERTREVGLLEAIGAGRRQILAAFLVEAALLSTAGGLAGLAVGWGATRLVVGLFPAFPAAAPAWAVAAALGLSVAVGVIFGFLPARRATTLDPVTALSRR